MLQGAAADRLRGEFGEFLTHEHNEEEFADFIDSYEPVLDQPVSLH